MDSHTKDYHNYELRVDQIEATHVPRYKNSDEHECDYLAHSKRLRNLLVFVLQSIPNMF